MKINEDIELSNELKRQVEDGPNIELSSLLSQDFENLPQITQIQEK